ncbi:inositol monophosphatase family protein [Kribbella sp. NPDC055071]
MDLAKLLKVAEAAVDRGRTVTDTRGPGELTFKGDRDMASEVDYAVERAVREFLGRETPEIAIQGEEEGGATEGDRWVLDPIDGTVNFIHGMPLWAISLGLVVDDRAAAGVIDHPALGTRYVGADGLGAFRDGQRIRGSECTDLRSALVAIGDFGVGEAASDNAIRSAFAQLLVPRVQRLRMLGAATAALTFAANGFLDAMVLYSNKPWDTMAGAAICREAGLEVLDLDGSPHSTASRGIVVAAPALAEPFLDLIAQSGL